MDKDDEYFHRPRWLSVDRRVRDERETVDSDSTLRWCPDQSPRWIGIDTGLMISTVHIQCHRRPQLTRNSLRAICRPTMHRHGLNRWTSSSKILIAGTSRCQFEKNETENTLDDDDWLTDKMDTSDAIHPTVRLVSREKRCRWSTRRSSFSFILNNDEKRENRVQMCSKANWVLSFRSSPVLTVEAGSKSMTVHSPFSVFGLCSTPRGTMNISPSFSTMSPCSLFLSWIVTCPFTTRNSSSSFWCECQPNSPSNFASFTCCPFNSPMIFGVQWAANSEAFSWTFTLDNWVTWDITSCSFVRTIEHMPIVRFRSSLSLFCTRGKNPHWHPTPSRDEITSSLSLNWTNTWWHHLCLNASIRQPMGERDSAEEQTMSTETHVSLARLRLTQTRKSYATTNMLIWGSSSIINWPSSVRSEFPLGRLLHLRTNRLNRSVLFCA